MDCPSCARKIETAVQKLPQVASARVIFASENLLVEAHSDIRPAIEQAVNHAGFSLKSTESPAPAARRWHDNAALILLTLLMIARWLLSQLTPLWGDRLFVLTTLVGLAPVARSAWQAIRSGSPFSIETLMTLAAAGALVISTPAAITSDLAAARQGALIKGGAALERLSRVQALAFDKTGTLTAGKPQVTDVQPFGADAQQQLLSLAAAIEQGSGHPLARAIVAEAQRQQQVIPPAQHQQTLAGSGIRAQIDGVVHQLLAPRDAAALSDAQQQQIAQLEAQGKTVVVVLREAQPLGLLALGIRSVMLTGDNPRAAAELGITYRAGLLPADKVAAVRELGEQQPLAMVGDGINDAPAMKAVTLGIAMGSGTDVALEAADAALTQNNLAILPRTVQLARRTRAIIRQNIALALGLKAIFLVTTLLGFTGLWLAVLADSGATALVTANALRLLRQR
ncbi:hypothetical protein E05_43170 [Plautia stali symbiont]|nr:hypothetical protein E05_43170 [Plautia stali symbiont]